MWAGCLFVWFLIVYLLIYQIWFKIKRWRDCFLWNVLFLLDIILSIFIDKCTSSFWFFLVGCFHSQFQQGHLCIGWAYQVLGCTHVRCIDSKDASVGSIKSCCWKDMLAVEIPWRLLLLNLRCFKSPFGIYWSMAGLRLVLSLVQFGRWGVI